MYYGNDMLEQFKYTGNQQNKKFLNVSVGTITSVDPDSYTAKVMLEPIGVETEWLPLGTMYAGNNFGLLALPDVGTEVLVVFEMGDIKCGKIICCNFNNIDKPPAVNPGEVIMLHKSGSLLKFNTDGSIEVSPDTVLKLAGGGAGLARKGDEVQVSVPNVGVCTGTITSGSSKVQSG
jgi:phage baseplate assembly protein gpV